MYSGAKTVSFGSVNQANMTSGSPGDIVIKSGEVVEVIYEVTTKTIDADRLESSADSVQAHGRGCRAVTWLCRKGIDTKHLDDADEISVKGVRMSFVDIESWISIAAELIGHAKRTALINKVNTMVGTSEIDQRVRTHWNAMLDAATPI